MRKKARKIMTDFAVGAAGIRGQEGPLVHGISKGSLQTAALETIMLH